MAIGDALRVVAQRARVHEHRADLVLDDGVLAREQGRVGMREAAVADHRERATLEGVTEAEVERHLGVVDVQRKVAVARGRILDGEPVAVVERLAADMREEGASERRADAREEVVEQRAEADLVEHHAVAVHRVGALEGAPGEPSDALAAMQLGAQAGAVRGRQQGQREDAGSYLAGEGDELARRSAQR